MTAVSIAAPKRIVELTVDGQTVRVTEGSTILDACRLLGIDTPTLCYGDTLTPVNVCRVCVVELERRAHARPGLLAQGRGRDGRAHRLASACARAGAWCSSCSARPSTSRPRPRRSRTSSATSAQPDRFGAGFAHRRAGGEGRQRPLRARLLEVHPLLQVRRGVRRRRPEHVRDRRRRPRLRRPHLDRARRAAARVGVRLLRQLRRGLPDGRADGEERVRPARGGRRGDEAEQTEVDTVCPYCGVGCNLTLHVQDDAIVKVTSPDDHDVTRGNLCIKGRFGYSYVQSRRRP